jgi:predicted nucleic acid-binding protein
MALRVYLDTSVLVALLLDDPFSNQADDLFRSEDVTPIVSDFAAAEFASATARRVRTGELAAEGAREAFADLDRWLLGGVERIETTSADVFAAGGLIRRLDLNLRTPDAIHIAVCRRSDAVMTTFDRGLAVAAEALGLTVKPGPDSDGRPSNI